MANAKKKVKKSKFKLSKRSIIFASIAGALVLVLGGFWLQSYLVEKQTLADLSDANKELRIVYDNILELNKDSIDSSYYRDDCSVSNVSWMEQRVSCGPSGRVVMAGAQEPSEVRNNLAKVDKNSGLNMKDITISNQTEVTSISANLESKLEGVNCYVGYGKNQLTNQWEYWMTCRKDVPNFLPGYTVEQ